ncbi:MAG: MaoC family dehydratase N-terminal domain-containing protein [Candidatus Lambdaproteobacteria bacterium]|nr:MaoC family dehydratase N-terminal domain-containing protein [Candidatus Lambdaproteobacteria bacterium]
MTQQIDITASTRHFPTIQDEELRQLRKRIGIKIEHTLYPWVSEATRDAIRHYAHGIGDDNPLWCDPDYARGTRYGDIVAPPTFLFATNRIVSGYVGGMPGVHAMFAGANWSWHRPTRRNDEIRTEAHLKDLIEHNTRFSGRAVQQIYHVDFFNQDGDLLAGCDSWCFRTERATAREKGTKYERERSGGRKVYSDEEVRDISRMYAEEHVQGATPRYWDDVREGEELPPIVKGPMTVTGFIAYVQGWGGLYVRAHKLAFNTFRSHPGLGIPNAYNIPDVPERVHWEEELAQAVGTPHAYDYGPERVSWMGHMMTNWIGDDGFLKQLNAKVVRHNPVGDTLTIRGKVTRKYQQGGEHLVACDLLATNQDGENSCIADAVAALPTRGT